jgi:hypothetical protein
VVPPPVGTVQPPPGTPNRTVYPIPAPQGTSVTGREFDDPTFDRLWRRTDYPVITGRVKRSFFWGPGSLTENLTEEYAEGMGGWRAVQYFDKARMEINNPNANRNDPFFVTNGLLAVELITGEMQVGNNQFRLRWPAQINIASDSDDPLAPTYASFRGAYARLNDNERAGKIVNARIDRQGHLDFEFGGVGYANLDRFGVRNVHFSSATLHNIPNVFWEFLNAQGLVYSQSAGDFRTEQIIQPWYYATGYPITDAYWAQVKIEGKEGTWVLIQPYQRRVLTYVPTAPEGFKVQMGNIGQHYFDWRYKEVGKPAALRDGCANGYPTLGFGNVYNGSTRMKIDLGCQLGREERLTVRRQRFEGGEVLGVVRLDSFTDRYHEDVFMLVTYGNAATAPFQLYQPEPAPAPNSMPKPLEGFRVAIQG